MKLINYKCKDCNYEEEFLYQDSEDIKESLIHLCPICGSGELKKYNFKNNKQQWKFMDEKV